MMVITKAARQIENGRAYREWAMRFWGDITALTQIVVEDFPDLDDATADVTRYHVDAMRDLALEIGALIVNYGHEE